MTCSLIPLDKDLDLGISEVLILIRKTVTDTLKNALTNSKVALKLCVGQDAGCEDVRSFNDGDCHGLR